MQLLCLVLPGYHLDYGAAIRFCTSAYVSKLYPAPGPAPKYYIKIRDRIVICGNVNALLEKKQKKRQKTKEIKIDMAHCWVRRGLKRINFRVLTVIIRLYCH